MRVQTKMKWVDINGNGIQVCEETCENMYIFLFFFHIFVYVQSMGVVNVFVNVHYVQSQGVRRKSWDGGGELFTDD